MSEQIKRQTAFKLRIGDILNGKPIIEEQQSPEGKPIQRFRFLELGEKKIYRINIVANIVDKYASEAEKKYSTFTIDDASGQIKLKIFGDDTEKFKNIVQGNTVIVIGTIRCYNDELYIAPEIIRETDPRYLLVRKLELDKEKPVQVNKEEVLAIKDQIIEMIKKAEDSGGVETDQLYHTLTNVSPEIISQEIQKMLEDGLAYEPRPGKIRYLG
ncbi:MAG: OB-fold nucleic acid binding domain-containing protein [Nanoarchaeota archaeon]